jgi:hypothetical protein
MTPKRTKPTNDSVVKLYLPNELKRALENLAQSRNIPLSALLRLIATDYIRQKG